MEKEKGITLISLIMYIVLLTFALVIVINVTSSLYYNLGQIDSDSQAEVSMAKINMFILSDIKGKGTIISDADSDSFVLCNGKTLENITYSVKNEVLYRNKVKICETSDNSMQIYLKIGEYSKTVNYIIE